MNKTNRFALLSGLLFAGMAIALLAFLAPSGAQASSHSPHQPRNPGVWPNATKATYPAHASYSITMTWQEPLNNRILNEGTDDEQRTICQGADVSKYQVRLGHSGSWVDVSGGANARSHNFTNQVQADTSYVVYVRACATHGTTDSCGYAAATWTRTPSPRPADRPDRRGSRTPVPNSGR